MTLEFEYPQADPIIQEPNNGQNFNRYSYVLNNPLSYTDPSGFSFFKKFLRPLLAIAITIFLPQSAFFTSTLGLGSFASTAVAGFLSGIVSGGGLKGGLFGAFSASLFFGIGEAFKGVQQASGGFLGSGLSPGAFGAKVMAHGVAGGVMSTLQGGKFGHGFASAGFTAAATPAIAANVKNVYAQGVASAIVGGTASTLSGGKFANGALTGAFSFAFNQLQHRDLNYTLDEYLEAVENGLWENATVVDGFENNAAVDAAAARANSSPASGTEDVTADPRYAEFLRRVGPATAGAALPRGVREGEKFMALAINGDGQVIVRRVAIFTGQGGSVGQLARGAGAIVHVHYSGLVQPPNGGDHSAVKFAGISSFVIGATGRNIWEVGRVNGSFYYRSVNRDAPGRWRRYPGN